MRNPTGIRQKLEDSGLRFTAQRYSVMSFLHEHHGHPTAAEIFEGVTAQPGAASRSSRATIYNNLRDLVQARLVREVAAEGRAARFDAKFIHHHHFICDTCGKVEDVPWYDIPKPATASLGKRVVRQVELILRGVCAACRPQRPASATRPT